MDQTRLERVRALMKAQGLSQIVVTATASVYYLTGYWVEPHERMLALYLDTEGRAVLYGNELFGLTSTPELPLVVHTDSDDPVAQLAQAVRPGELGVDKFWYSKFLMGLMAHRPDVKPVSGSVGSVGSVGSAVGSSEGSVGSAEGSVGSGCSE